MAQPQDPLAGITSQNVGVLVRVVPDGFIGDKLRLSLVLAPDTRKSPRGKMFPLHEWPSHVGELIRNIRLYSSEPVGTYPVARRDLDARALLGADALLDIEQRKRAQRLWLEIFGADADGAANGFQKLYAMLQEEQGVTKDQRLTPGMYLRREPVTKRTRRARTTADILNKIIIKNTVNVYSYPLAEAAAIISFLRFVETLAHVLRNWDRNDASTFRGLLEGRFWAADDSLASGLRWRVSSTETRSEFTAHLANRIASYFAKAFDAGGFAPFVDGSGGTLGRLSSPRAPLRSEILEFLHGGGRAGDGIVAADQRRNTGLVEERRAWQKLLQERKSGTLGSVAASPVSATAERQELAFLKSATLDDWKAALTPLLDNFFADGQSTGLPDGSVGVGTLMQRLSESLLRAEISWLADRAETNLSKIDAAAAHDDIPPDDPLDPPLRKFHGIMGQAALARFLGLVVDVTVDASALIRSRTSDGKSHSTFGELAADLWGGDRPPSVDPWIWTAFKHVAVADAQPRPIFFGPATSYEWLYGLDEGTDQSGNEIPAAMPYRNGLLDLSAQMQIVDDANHPIVDPNGNPVYVNRYELVSLDVTAALNSIKSRAQNQANAYERGTLQADLASTLPSCHTRGIALIDRARPDDVVREIIDAKANQADADKASVAGAPFTDRLVLKAEDLTIGSRVDVGLASSKANATGPSKAHWGSITARRVEYRDSRIPEAARKVPPAFRSREDNSVCPATKEHMVDQADAEAVAAAQSILAAGDLKINGAYADKINGAYVATFDDAYPVTITTEQGNGSVSFKVAGTDGSGTAIDETISGSVSGPDDPAKTTKSFKTVARVHASAAVRGNAKVGIDGDGAAVMAHQMICTWTGESLAVPPWRGPVYLDPTEQLAVELCYDLPKEPASDTMPPLRNGRSYFVGARLVYINQGGLSFDDAVKRYRDEINPVVLGDNSTGDMRTPFRFLMQEKIARPDVLLPVNDPLVTDFGQGKIRFPGDQIDTLVVRSGEMLERKLVRRFIAPASVSFDSAEQFGSFDDDDEDSPSGAMVDVRLCPSGAYPVATDSGPICPPKVDGTQVPSPHTKVRGPYLEFSSRTHNENAHVYPNPMARWARLALSDGDVQRRNQPSSPNAVLSIAVRYWTRSQKAREARPLLLSIVPMDNWKPGEDPASFNDSYPLERVPDVGSAHPGTARHVQLRVAPAEEVTLQIWSESDGPNVLGSHWIGPMWERFILSAQTRNLVGPPAPEFQSLYDLANSLPIDQNTKLLATPVPDADGRELPMGIFGGRQNSQVLAISTRRALTVIHAVQRPLSAPAVAHETSSAKQRLRFNVVGLPDGSSSAWSAYVSSPPNGATDPLTWTTLPNGQSWFFTGAVDLDRRSTGVIRCEGFWDEYDDSRPQQDQHKNFAFQPKPAQDVLFTIQNLPRSGQSPLDLLSDEGGALRGLSYAFPSRYPKGKARRVRLRIVATSRYPKFFTSHSDAENPSGIAALSQFEKESVEARTVAKLDPEQKFEMAVWFKSSVRPPPPLIDCILPEFSWEVLENEPGRRFKIRRRAVQNVRLRNVRPADEWYKSGEDEKMGLVCWPPELFDNPSPPASGHELEDRLSTLQENEPLVTAWGSDPIRLSGVNEPLIQAKSFFGYDTTFKPAKVLLPPPEGTPPAGSPNDDTAKRAVVVLPFDAVLNSTYGYRECKIGILPGRNYSPMVRLGLVRYQPHAIDGYEISQPVVDEVPMLPTRYVVVEVLDSGRRIHLLVYGQGFHQAQPGLVAPPAIVDVNHPLLNVRLRRATDDGEVTAAPDGTISWKPVLNERHCPVEFPLLSPTLTDQVRGRVLWVCDVPLPTYRGEVHYGIEIDEVIMMPEDAEDGRGTVFKPGAPVFSYTVDLWREPAVPGGVGPSRGSRDTLSSEGLTESPRILTVPEDEM
jgi:hypothetical protein